MNNVPEQPKNSFRVILNVTSSCRLDGPLLEYLRAQNENNQLKNISRSALKELFKNKRIQIKGQRATQSSTVAVGTTYVDILGFGPKES